MIGHNKEWVDEYIHQLKHKSRTVLKFDFASTKLKHHIVMRELLGPKGPELLGS